MKGQDVVLCPQCGENKVKGHGTMFKSMLALGLIACITIIGIPIGIILILTGLLMKYSKIRLKFTCQACKHEFKVTEDTYNNYTKSIG